MLFEPPAFFKVPQTNLPATPASGAGTTVTASGTATTKGAWAELITLTSDDSYLIRVQLSAGSTTNAGRLVDIGIGAAGVEIVVLPDLFLNAPQTSSTSPVIIIPFFIPKGSRVSARMASSTASQTCIVSISLFGGPSRPTPFFTRCDAYGSDASSSTGVAVASGATGVFGSWVNVGSTTSIAYAGLMALVGILPAATRTMHWEIGYLSTTIYRFLVIAEASNIILYQSATLAARCSVPSGTQLQARSKSASGAVTLDIIIYGLR